MTEPTHDTAPDPYWNLDILVESIVGHAIRGRDQEIRDMIRGRLSSAWHEGWLSGFGDGKDGGRPAGNPWRTPAPATPAPELDAAKSDIAE